MYIDFVPNRGSKPAILLRESIREGKRIRKRTIANLSALTLEQAEAIRLVLKGEKLGPAGGGLDCIRSLPHGHVEAVRVAMRRLGFEKLIDGKASRERDLVVAMVAGRIVAPEASKLALTHAWTDTTLAEDLGVPDAHEDELYAAMDWLIERQDKIEKRLAKRHLKEGGLVLFDLTSSSFEGVTCPLAKIGYSRDGKPGTLQVNYGLLTDARGCPVAVSVFEGNTADPKTLLPQVEKVRDSFGIASLVMVGDRGMISNVQIEAMRTMEGVDWITALKSGAIARLVDAGQLQLGLFDERNLIELYQRRLSRRAARGLPQSGACQAARGKTQGPDRCDGARASTGCGHGRRRQALRARQDRRPRWQGHWQVQDGQALRSRYPGCGLLLQRQ